MSLYQRSVAQLSHGLKQSHPLEGRVCRHRKAGTCSYCNASGRTSETLGLALANIQLSLPVSKNCLFVRLSGRFIVLIYHRCMH